MKPSAKIALGVSALLLVLYVINLVLARSGGALFGTVAEMLVLFAATACFGVGTLIVEAEEETKHQE